MILFTNVSYNPPLQAVCEGHMTEKMPSYINCSLLHPFKNMCQNMITRSLLSNCPTGSASVTPTSDLY